MSSMAIKGSTSGGSCGAAGEGVPTAEGSAPAPAPSLREKPIAEE
jgi:hypothetical protein